MPAEVLELQLFRKEEEKPPCSSEGSKGTPLLGSMEEFFKRMLRKLQIKGISLSEEKLILEFLLSPAEEFANTLFSHVQGVGIDSYLVGVKEVDWEETKTTVESSPFGVHAFKVTLAIQNQALVSEKKPEKLVLLTRYGNFEVPGS